MVTTRVFGGITLVEFLGSVETIPVMKCLTHVGQEEAVLGKLLQSQWQGAPDEEAVPVSMLKGQLRLSSQIDTLEGTSSYLRLFLVKDACHFPVILYL